MLQDLLIKYQSFTTKQQVWLAVGVFILALVILPNVLYTVQPYLYRTD